MLSFSLLIEAKNFSVSRKIEKVSFERWLKTYIWKAQHRKRLKLSWMKSMAHLLLSLKLFTIGWMSLNVAVHPQKINIVRTSSGSDYLRNDWQNPRYVLSDRRIKAREIVEATGISQRTVFSIFHEKLGVKKISTRWVPRLLLPGALVKICRFYS